MIKRNAQVGYGGSFSRSNNELILTSQSLILIKKNLFGKVKEVMRFPLSDIVVSNNQAQVRLGKKDLATHTLDVYFTSGRETFRLTWEDEIKEWANEINTLVTGQPAIYKQENWMAGFENLTASFNGAVKNLKKAFGVKSTEKISGKCPACGASITGTEGETVQCPYCGTYYTFT